MDEPNKAPQKITVRIADGGVEGTFPPRSLLGPVFYSMTGRFRRETLPNFVSGGTKVYNGAPQRQAIMALCATPLLHLLRFVLPTSSARSGTAERCRGRKLTSSSLARRWARFRIIRCPRG